MSQMRISTQQSQSLLAARTLHNSARKAEKKKIFAAIKFEHGIPSSKKIVLFIENPNNPLYRVIRDAKTKLPLDNGVAEPVATPTVAKSPAGKAPAKKATVKAWAKKVAAKKAPVKTSAKKVAAKKAPVKAAKAEVGYPKQVRITHKGSRVRIGTAKNAAHEKRLIAAYKKANA